MNASLRIPLVYREQVRRAGKRTTHVRPAFADLLCEVPVHDGGIAFTVDGGELEGDYIAEPGRFWMSAPPGSAPLARVAGTERVHDVVDAGEVVIDDDYDLRSSEVRGLALRRCRSHGGVLYVPAAPPCWGVLVDALRGKVGLGIVSRDRLGPSTVLIPLRQRDAAVRLAAAVAGTLCCPWDELSRLTLRGMGAIEVPCPSLDDQERAVEAVLGTKAVHGSRALFAMARRVLPG